MHFQKINLKNKKKKGRNLNDFSYKRNKDKK